MITRDYSLFWKRIHSLAKKKEVLLRVMFELTYRCNFFCKHCYVPSSYRNKGELPLPEVFSLIDQLREIGCFYLGFTGGEPFMRSDIMDILWYAKRSGFEVIVYTNGYFINHRIAGELGRLKPNKVDITIPAMSESSFEKITGVKGAKDKVFAGIELLSKNKVNLGFKTCILEENQAEIHQIHKFVRSLGALHRIDSMLSRRLDGSAEPYKYRGLWKTLSQPDRLCTFGKPVPDNLFYCGVGQSQAAITPLGELKMCVMIDYPRYKIGTNLKENWEKLKQLVKRIKPDANYKCNSCELASHCKWCPARSWLYNRTWTACDPQIKEKIEEEFKVKP